MKKQKMPDESMWTEEFENLYILTYLKLYRHGKLIFHQEDKVRELLILTYMEAYQRRNQLQKEKSQIDWLLKRLDLFAERKLGATKDILEAAYAEEKMQSKEAKKEQPAGFDETSLLLEIEDRLGLSEEPETQESRGVAKTALQGLLSFLLLLAAVGVLLVGGWKIKNCFYRLSKPETTAADETAMQETKQEHSCIQVGDKAVFLSDTGQILYSVPLSEANLTAESEENPEIQTWDGWTYYLPCPEREDTHLSRVKSDLYHTLYRMRDSDTKIEIVAKEVENYNFWENAIYISQHDAIQRIPIEKAFPSMETGIYVSVEDQELCLYETLGRTLNTQADGRLVYEDRVFSMSANRITEVKPGVSKVAGRTFVLKQEERGTIYAVDVAGDRVFADDGISIDCFCMTENWLYYSVWSRNDENGAAYSVIYRKPLVGDRAAEQVGEEFRGQFKNMYYEKESGEIYAEYLPMSWKHSYGKIAVISPRGEMSCLDDEVFRKHEKTAGNDMLEFVLEMDGQVYCFWKNYKIDPADNTVRLDWKKVLVIPKENKIPME